MITSEADLRALIGEPTPLVQAKLATRLNSLTRQFIERSPFLCLATSAKDGSCDVSPRGDPRGFVRILDDETILLPERPGNRIADSLRNILSNPHVGLLFLIPGVTDSFRVNGRASLITDQSLLAPCEVEGKIPKLGILVKVLEAYTQCSKALIRSELWNPAHFVDRSVLPTNGPQRGARREEVRRRACCSVRAARGLLLKRHALTPTLSRGEREQLG